ncbi:NAD-dependent protein deacylase [Fusobacterium perfoetens]|uniref:NAD-dependent protein deacylase n=1 Tax=Fusobacterium perfoetens TaxID=852 RepID=UPI001F1AB302|nr:NAD-dependent protein deacylase [Fusobacterium perfoetens]MCF2612621.1 NAD-dependent protein deacylase [Fusobacterium perfoetens]
MDDKIKKLADLIKTSEYVVFFGGAGTSTDSGLLDFRGRNGLYNQRNYMGYEPEEILSIDFFLSHTDIFNKYIEEKLMINDVKPNAGHIALAELEKMGKVKAVITQNIDNLHQEGGSKKVLELHGTLKDWYCLKCGKRADRRFDCECGGVVRPRVTLYGEMLDEKVTDAAISEIKKADTLIIAGTSLTVYPAAYYISYFRGKNLVIINETPTSQDERANLVIRTGFANTMTEMMKILKNK